MNIFIEEKGNKGRAFIENDLAEMTFSRTGETLLIIDHTHVDESLKGQGIGRAMLEQIVQMARNKSLKIMPFCQECF